MLDITTLTCMTSFGSNRRSSTRKELAPNCAGRAAAPDTS
jgi:hypothetical protein